MKIWSRKSYFLQGLTILILSSLTLIAAIYAAGVRTKQLVFALALGGFAFCGIW